MIKKVKNNAPWIYVSYDLNGEEIVGTFYEKELQKTRQKEFRIEKVIKRKGGRHRLYLKWKGYVNSFNNLINMKDIIKMSQYFPESYERSVGNVKVELDLSNHATKADAKRATGLGVFMLASKTDLASLKTSCRT